MDEDTFREFLKVSFFNANTVMKEGAVFYGMQIQRDTILEVLVMTSDGK